MDLPIASSTSADEPVGRSGLDEVVQVLAGRIVVVLSGAGISTESGIPDYRGPDGPRRKTPPIQYRDFVTAEATRIRYWARSAIGWPHFACARPNAAHQAIARLERAGLVAGIITQNVDQLHQKAGSRRVIELHGALAEVICMNCGAVEPRAALQRRLLAMNPRWEGVAASVAPDGDADLPGELTKGFRIPVCLVCTGTLKPNVVLFGENVPKERAERAFALLDAGEALLVAGSSLAVYSGFRFVERASRRGIPVAIVNMGSTRGDALSAARLDGRLGTVLPNIAERLLKQT